ncbi:hypothetical protein FHT32_001005 [Variovorax sp. SG517]|uniref:hypothetical protein n=1 Tax=Variovorax sp. SG517 TaxID=2587117 RepID=UPI00159DDD92|nr:hypothetical protein [Variovorax sp. SG517]NVM87382.1 hypothetical protein [Variovorax sp. SG517]
MTHGTTQNVKIETMTTTGKVVDGAKCLVSNDRNDVVMRSGDTVPVRRSGANLTIECTQPGFAPAHGQAVSRANVGMAGNILIGGMIGAVVDASTAAGYNYPSWIQLVFGEVRSVDRSAQSGEGPTAGIRIGTTEMASAPPVTPPKVAEAKPPEEPRPSAAPAKAVEPAPPAAPAPSQAIAPSSPPPRQSRPETRVSMDDLNGLLPGKP